MTTPEQLQVWRTQFEADYIDSPALLEKRKDGDYVIGTVLYMWAGYLRRCQETEQVIKAARKQALEEVYNLCEAVEIDTWNTSGKRAVARCVNEILKLQELLNE